MKAKHLKFHVTAIAIIVGVILILFSLLGPKPVAENSQATSSRAISIESATWGENCNPYIDTAIREWRLPPAGSKEKTTERPERVEFNNVYKTVSQQCNGRITCMFKADVKTLNVDPLHSCFKKLNVRYRCFSYDRLWNLEISQGKNLEIDCHDEDTKEDSAS